jgi:hypothetical protein
VDRRPICRKTRGRELDILRGLMFAAQKIFYSGPLKDGPLNAAQYRKGPFVVAHDDKPIYDGPFLGPLMANLLN